MDSKKFWADFEKQYWEKNTGIFKNISSLPLPQFPEDQMFQLVTRFFDWLRKRNYESDYLVRLYINGKDRKINKDTDHFLPRQSDGSFVQYNKRCESYEGVEEYGLVLNDMLSFDRGIWENFCVTMKPLFDRFGIPKLDMEGGLFIGNYTRTPFGVHADPCAVFTFPVVGIKRIRTWTKSYKEKHPEIKGVFDYKKHMKKSVLLKGKPGEMFYFPSDRWHIGESTGKFSVSVAVGYWYGDIGRYFLNKEFAKRTQKELQTETSMETIQINGADLSFVGLNQLHIAHKEIGVYRKIANSEEIERAVDVKWVKHISAYGFNSVPEFKKGTPLSINSVIRVDTHFPLVWVVRHDGECLVACRGNYFGLKNGGWLPMLLQLLNSGNNYSINELCVRFARSHITKKKIMSVLESIQAVGGFLSTDVESLIFKFAA